jgi:DNA mismatch endonuclease (patch repair protein)
MPDVFTREKRSDVMSRIRGRGNRETELRFAGILRRNAIRGWRRHVEIIGRPDFSFAEWKIAVFIDGCFWHCCPKCGNMPKNNRAFWKRKLEGNVSRDRTVTAELKKLGWRVMRVWEHELPQESRLVARLLRYIEKSNPRSRK